MRTRVAALAVGILTLVGTGCTTAPKTHDFDPVTVIRGDFDAVWSAAVEFFAVSSLPIQTIEKDSGLIVTSWMDASGSATRGEDKTFCDCGGSGLTIQHWTRGKFNIFAKAVAGGTELRVTCTYQQRRELFDVFTAVSCPSTGYLEKLVHDYARAKVEGVAPPSVPTFTPGEPA